MIFPGVRFDELSSDQLRELPKEWIVHHMGRPVRSRIVSPKRATRFRSVLIAALCIYAFATQRSHLPAALELRLIGYEVAYYTLWQAKLEDDYIDYLRAYAEAANNLPEWPAIEE